MRQALIRLRHWFFSQKYRFDLGNQFMIFLNFTLLVLTAGDKLKKLMGIQYDWVLILFVPVGFLGMWAFGFFLDKVVRAPQMSERQGYARSELWQKLFEQLDRIESNGSKE